MSSIRSSEVATSGAALAEASVAVIMVHGRGGSAEGFLRLAEEFAAKDIAYLAPQAPRNSWYPYSFLAPLSFNAEGIAKGHTAIDRLVTLANSNGIDATRVVLLGFSQGACLALEYAARSPRTYGGIVGLSGGLIGNGQIEDAVAPDDKEFFYNGELPGVPVFLGCSDVDSHVPVRRVERTGEVLANMGAAVEKRIYPGMGHTVNRDEIGFVQSLLTVLAKQKPPSN